jgi:hypothetical protein
VINRYNRLEASRYLSLRAISRQELLPNYQEKSARARTTHMALPSISSPPIHQKHLHLLHQTLGLQQAPGLISSDRIFYTQLNYL